jgi:flavin reductase (DIM6/NTAB) family NADH-FMN oxidoreductase RutF
MDYSNIAPMMGNLWSPIAAVSSHWRGQDNAQLCVSIGGASIVAERPRVLVQIYKTNHSHEMIMGSGAFALNFPRAGQLEWIRDFGLYSARDRDKLVGVEYSKGATGSPLFADCWGWLDCRVVNAMDGGDMTCFLGEVLDGETLSESEPLWWRDARRIIPAEWNTEWDRKITGEIENSIQQMGQIDYSPWKSGS